MRNINLRQLPSNPALKDKARHLRKAGNLSEVLFWKQVKNKQFKNLDFHRQIIIGNYIVDFACPCMGVIIEIDGISHDFKANYDLKRDEFLKSVGFDVIHISDADVKRNLSAVMDWLDTHPLFN